MSASFGGLLRDTLLGRDSVMLGAELYVTAALAGASSYVLLQFVPGLPSGYAVPLAMVPAFVLRAGAIVAAWRLPAYRRLGE
jgi:uncharacterized membrane protein YeiH